MSEPTRPERKKNFRAERVAIETRRGKITFPSVRKAAVALKIHRTKLTAFLRTKHPRNAYYEGFIIYLIIASSLKLFIDTYDESA
jgi:hypothetical protein